VEDGWQTFQVVDQGPGVPVEYQQAIFEKFRQVEISEAGVAKGTGLGLAFCKLAVEAHGGSISMHSPVFECPEEQKRGSAFIVKLPPASPRTTGDGKRRL
jgi:signal transduction histidine kinase